MNANPRRKKNQQGLTLFRPLPHNKETNERPGRRMCLLVFFYDYTAGEKKMTRRERERMCVSVCEVEKKTTPKEERSEELRSEKGNENLVLSHF